jgi:molybdopterin converting factor small subunit
MPVVFIPSMLREFAQGVEQVDVPAGTLDDAIDAIDARFPGFREAVVEDGRLRNGVAVAVNGETTSPWLIQPIPEGAEVHFVAAISGG